MKFYVNLRYLIVPISSLVTILGILLGVSMLGPASFYLEFIQ